MKTRFNILGIISLTVALALIHSDRTFAASTLVGKSAGVFGLPENTSPGVTTLPVTPSTGFVLPRCAKHSVDTTLLGT